MSAVHQVGIRISVDTKQVSAQVPRAAAELENMGQRAAQAGEQAARGVRQAGAAGKQLAQELSTQAPRAAAELERMGRQVVLTGEQAAHGVRQAGAAGKQLAQELSTQAPRAAAELERMGQRAAQAGGQVARGMHQAEASSKQMAMALRTVPMQMTDVVTSLASGTPPLQVLIQQGGQLKDMFGGVVPALKAVGGYVLGLVNPLTLAAAAAGALALAAYQGSREMAGYSNALILTGNAAGATAGQMANMAREIANGTHTQGAAAAALVEMVQAQAAGADGLQRYTQVALEWQRVTGTAVSETAAAFASLRQAPLEASLKLNEGLNYLTSSTYEHIKSLNEQGRSVDAARVAQDAYADAMADKTEQMTENLGYIERGWRAVKDAARAAWEAMANVGRQESVADQLEKARRSLDERVQRGPLNEAPGMRDAWEKGNDRLRKTIVALQEKEQAERKAAAAAALNADRVKAKAEWDKKSAEFLDKATRKEQERAKAIELAGRAFADSAQREAALKKMLADIDEKYADKGGRGRAARAARQAARQEARELRDDLRALAQSAGLAPNFYEEWDKLSAAFKRGRMSVQELDQAQAELLAKQPAIRQAAEAERKELEELARMRAELSEREYKRVSAYVESVEALDRQNESLREEVVLLGLSKEEQLLYHQAKLDSVIATKEDQLARMHNEHIYTREQAALEEEIRLLKERRELMGAKAAKLVDEESVKDAKKGFDDLRRSLADNLMRGGKSGAEYIKDVFRTLVLRPTIEWAMTPLASALQNLLGGLLGGGSGGLLGGLFGSAGQGGVDLAGLLSNANTLQGVWGLVSNWLGVGTGAGAGTLAAANAVGMLGGDALGAFIAGNGGWGTLGGGAAASSLAALGPAALFAAAVLASMMDDSGTPHRGGAAFANSGGRGDRAWSTYDGLTVDHERGLLPSRAALIAALRERGFDAESNEEAMREWMRRNLAPGQVAPDGRISDYGLYSILEAINQMQPPRRAGWADGENQPAATGLDMEGLGRIVGEMRNRPDWYRGAGFMDPRELGLGVDYDGPAVAAARRVSEGILGSLERVMAGFGRSADFSVATGFADDSSKDGAWGALRILMDGRTLVDWSKDQTSKWAPREFADGSAGYQQYLRAIAGSTLDAFKELDLPQWAQAQIDAARAELDKLEGDKAGEQAAALIDRLTASMAAMATTIGRLIDVIPQFNNATQDMVHQLGEHFGGADKLGAAYNSFISNYWSEDERRALMLRQIEAELSGFGVTLPDLSQGAEAARAQFRALVEGVDWTTEEGRKLLAALLRVQGAFAELIPAADDAQDAVRQLAERLAQAQQATDAALDNLQRFADGQTEHWRRVLAAAEDVAAEAQGIFELAGQHARDLRGEVQSTRHMQAAEGQAAIARMLQQLRSTGALPDQDELARAIEGARGGLDINRYASVAEYERDQLVLAGKLSDMGEIAGGQLSEAQQQVELARKQIEFWEQQMDHWRRQVELLRGLDTTVTSLDEGVAKLVAAMEEERAAKAEANKPKKPEGAAGGGSSGGGGTGGHAWAPSGYGTWDEKANRLLLPNGGYIDYTTGIRHHPDGSQGRVSQIELDRFKREALERGRRVPAYAKGGFHPGGPALVGEEGMEIVEFAQPAYIHSARDSRRLLERLGDGGGSERVVAEMRQLNALMGQMLMRMASMEAHAGTTSGILGRLSSGGNGVLRVGVVSGGVHGV